MNHETMMLEPAQNSSDNTVAASAGMRRRSFLGVIAGTAGVPAISGVAGALSLAFPTQAAAQGATPEINAWVVVQPDEKVIIRIARSEMGQGTLTGLAQLVADELGCDWARVSTEYPTPTASLKRSRVWGDYSTGGSRGIRQSHDYVRKGGAAARMMLVQAAANQWGVDPASCSVDKGIITHAASGRKTSYGAVAATAAQLPAPTQVTLKDPAAWTLAGKRMARLDTVEKTNGGQVYGIDLNMPGLLNAAIKECPVFGGKVKSFDAAAISSRKGVVKVVKVGETAVAVIAEKWWQAKTALDALPITWDFGPNASIQQSDVDAMLKEGLTAASAVVGNSRGDAKGELAKARRTIEAVYAYPHQNHATLEPMNATARVQVNAAGAVERCEVWAPTQNGEAALAAAAEAAGIPPTQCEIYKINLGGGFGRRGAFHDWLRQSVLIARQMPGTPIKLLWTREEDMTQGRYHPVTQCKLTAALDDKGDVQALHMRLSGQSILMSVFPNMVKDGKDPVAFQGLNEGGGETMIGYTFPNLLIDHAVRNPHVPPGFWRGVNLNQNTLYLECFIDEIAHATGQDPMALRRKLMANHPKHLRVLEAVAERSGWGKPAPDVNGQKVYRGLAQCHGFGSYVAACAEVSVSAEGQLKVHRIVAATDCGHAVNPQQIEAQVEGSFVYGLGAALHSSCTVKDGRIEQTNFNTYRSLSLAEMPKVETVVIPSGGFWGGVGEPTIAVAAPAVLNAIFAATGKRIRQLPIGQQSLKRTA